ncbi:hypothetical protein Ana3638_09130 [Anaerocolumna sedimenticola]|uniref:Membrane fusion protein biotin-lipoyl like domain-containing protein n=1 Tax=Anaerocolumna sedimenticola TaxID=2696063 RepID=A0A6P1TL83_9FIRM|nr:hypothetical protein [Anaerocolumna sedimenticola]QHQ60909.1 hypothetical protein Ana3638_09130 [Anaerocolumna sedimenticola]
MENKLRRLLFIFFILMAFFTVVSRAAASVMVARVEVTGAKEGELSYEISGTGTVKENAQKYITLSDGLKIGKVSIKTGQQLEKGDLLFQYDLTSLLKKKSSLENELTKLQLQYDKTGLTGEEGDGLSEVKAAQMAKENAEEDLKAAERVLADIKENTKKEKEKEFKEASLAWEDLEISKEEAKKETERAVTDAKRELSELNKPQQNLMEKLEEYKEAVISKKEKNIEDVLYEIYDFYYKGKYEEHLAEKSETNEKLKRAKEDLKDIKKKWDTAINEDDKDSDEEAVRKAYEQQLLSKKEEIKNADRAVEDAKDSLLRLSEKDDELNGAINNYREDLEENDRNNMGKAYAALYQFLYDTLEVNEEKISTAETKLSRAKEDEAQVNKQWDSKLKDAFHKKEELNHVLKNIENGTYDYKEELKEGKKAVTDAKRALMNAELSLAEAKETRQLGEENKYIQQKSIEIDQSILLLDLNGKQAEIDELQRIITDKGKVTAPVAGVVTKNDLEQGGILTGQEKLVLATGGYELSMNADKEDMKRFAVGDELQIDTGTDNDKITSRIENIGLPDQDGKVKFSALLPEGNYSVGGSLDYEISKESQAYPRCIPVQGLREDSKGTYILLVKEKDSVLGKKDTAFRLDITVISQDTKSAAIDASLSDEDQIITGSNKNISEGDRVRIYEME